MRKCIRCNEDMVDGYLLNVEGKLYGVNLSNEDCKKIYKNTEKIFVSVCPKCGEISLYVDKK
ncbi:hypothetical protein SAMN02745248_00372 [Hathewaya proteolytica DSM 3090]|uniref:Nucleic acid-binding protein n=1 Tax=Hathewaya proteolytica DSM 3090 TaxID=1121331 RepID=A0A1M6K8H2_9CLOT|nr:hypothetical protein [Hathewaya proteolytica]SHJ55213.1 hypothetical protein SAMN02745248_00372 [Hathewaya proteolytica DSM 3090]